MQSHQNHFAKLLWRDWIQPLTLAGFIWFPNEITKQASFSADISTSKTFLRALFCLVLEHRSSSQMRGPQICVSEGWECDAQLWKDLDSVGLQSMAIVQERLGDFSVWWIKLFCLHLLISAEENTAMFLLWMGSVSQGWHVLQSNTTCILKNY